MEVNLNERDRTVMKVDEGRWRRIEGREEKSPCERSTVFKIVYDFAVQRALPFSAFSFLPAAHGRSDYVAYTALIRFLLVLFIFFFFFLILGGAARIPMIDGPIEDCLSSVRFNFFFYICLFCFQFIDYMPLVPLYLSKTFSHGVSHFIGFKLQNSEEIRYVDIKAKCDWFK